MKQYMQSSRYRGPARTAMITTLISLIVVVAANVALASAVSDGHRPWLAPGLPIDERVRTLMAVMTRDEKIAQLSYECATSWNWNESSWASTSIGAVGIECSKTTPGDGIAARVASLRGYQLGALNQSRLGIPVSFAIETSHCGAAGGTIFPMGATQGATWNVALVGRIAAAIALEARAWGGDRGLSPEINVVTDPRFGRTEENFGEEPLLVSAMAEAAVVALQGGRAMPTEYLADPSTSIIAEAKHCCVYGFSGLDGGAADVSEKTLHDVYLKPWRAYIRAGGRGMMMSHNELNGIPMHANHDIMNDLFRVAWNYSGFCHSDYGNVGALTNAHVASNQTMAAALALHAGVDQTFCDSSYSVGVLGPAIDKGIVPLADLDRATYNILTAKFAAGLFDGVLPDPARAPTINSQDHRDLARLAAQEGAVLLTNQGALPLPPLAGKRVALIGPFAGCPSGGCTTSPSVDCTGNDITKVSGVTNAAACCAICANTTGCVVSVLATDESPTACLLKSACGTQT